MKNIFTALFLLSVLFSSAQNFNVQVTEGNEKVGTGNNNALIVTIYENSLENVEKEWKSRVKDFNPEKTKLNNDELFADNATIKEMGNNPADIYTRFVEDKTLKTVKMIVAVDLGGAYLSSSSHKDKFEIMKKIIRDFSAKMTKEAIDDQAKDATKVLGKLEDKQKDLEKDKKNLQDDIKNYQEKIKKAEEEIKTNEKAQELKKKEIEDQKKVVEVIKKKQVEVK